MSTVPTNVMSTASVNSDHKKVRYTVYRISVYRFISDHITIYNYNDLLSLCKT